MKKVFAVLLAVLVCFTAISCGDGSETGPEPLESLSINSSDIKESTEWFPIDADTEIDISEIADSDVLVVVKKSASAKELSKGITKGNNSKKGGLTSSETGNTIVRPEDGGAKFAGSGVGASNGVYYAKVEKLPSQSLSDVKDLKLEVFDYEGRDKEKVHIEKSAAGDYFVSEKTLHVNLNQSNKEALSKCVITREFQYFDGEYGDSNYTGLHNTRDTYGFLMKNQGNYIIKNSGVCDISKENFVNLYAGFASNVVMGSGMKLRIVPVTVITPSTPRDKITSNDAAIGIEQGSDKTGEYVLKLTLYEGPVFDRHTLKNTSTEIRKYNGEELPTGVAYSYGMNDKTVYYFLGSITGDFYVDNHVSGNSIDYDVELMNYADVPVKELKVDHADKVIFEVNTTGTSGITTTSDTVKFTEVKENLTGYSKHMSLLLTGIPRGNIDYKVTLEKYDATKGEWVSYYDNSVLQCTIGHNSTGNRLLEYHTSANNGNLPVQCSYWGIDAPLRATIEFTYPD